MMERLGTTQSTVTSDIVAECSNMICNEPSKQSHRNMGHIGNTISHKQKFVSLPSHNTYCIQPFFALVERSMKVRGKGEITQYGSF